MISFDQALALIGETAMPLGPEQVALGAAQARILAAPVAALVDAPAQDHSAMDGYAVRDADLRELPAMLALAGESRAGRGHGQPIAPGSCIRIFTGAPVPPGADRVVIQEEVRRLGELAIFDAPPGAARHIRARGSDFRAGDILLPAGRLLDPRALVAAAAADRDRLEVWRRPRLALVTTGDELTEPGSARSTPGKVPESASPGVAALARQWGAEAGAQARFADDLPLLQKAAAALLDGCDLLVVIGGASVGERDFAKAMFEPAGLELLFSKVAMKPGKPVWLGRVRSRLVLGLPGNPTSAMVAARLFLAPLLAGMTGRPPLSALRWRTVALAAPLPACGERESFIRAADTPAGARPLENQDSSAQKSLSEADLLIRRPAGALAAAAGEPVAVIDF